jgi:hypothetical protein
LLLLAPLLVAATAAAQNMYKWVDENGRVTYSDQPPVGKVQSQEVIRIIGSANTLAPRQVADQDAQFNKRQDDATKKQAEIAKKEQLEAARQDSCSRARAELRALRDSHPLVRMTESGDRVLLDAGARETESRRLETFVGENCAQAGG